jgi:predicted Zn-dependent protease
VVVRPTARGLDIRDDLNTLVAFWRTEDLETAGAEGAYVRVRCSADPYARLAVKDPAFAAVLPRPAAGPRAKRKLLKVLAMALACVAVPATLAYSVRPAARLVAALLPAEAEAKLGGTMARALTAHAAVCSQPAGQAALSLLAARLGAGPELRIEAVDSATVNAIALPGGRIMVFKGLLAELRGPDELAGILAHEISHVRERHASASVVRAVGVGALVAVVTGDASGALAGMAATALAAAYTREDEAAADRGAVELLTRAGLGTEGLATFFRRLAERGAAEPQWLASHPAPEARARAVAAMALKTMGPAPAPALSAEQWAAVKRICG